jgi:fido (protein-threonine AMPylation protein)
MGGYEPVVENTNSADKAAYWKAGIGLQRVDGLEVSANLHKLADSNIRGLIGYDVVEQTIIDDYSTKDLTNPSIRNGFEADLVAARIVRLLSEVDFILASFTLKSIHKSLFRGLELLNPNLTPGEFKTQNWRKSEPVLYGHSVRYGRATDVAATLEELIHAEERRAHAVPVDKTESAALAHFCARLWEVHPFSEGNTRTVAVFIEKYLIKMGYRVNNDYFEEHSIYFRDALVRACYANAAAGVAPTAQYINRFFENLLLDTRHSFLTSELYAHELEKYPDTR